MVKLLMYNWNTDLNSFKSKEESTVWKLNQLINFGLNGEKLNLRLVKKYWDKLYIDANRRKFLSLLIWGKTS